MAHTFHPTNLPDTCLWCGEPLPLWIPGNLEVGRGYEGEGHFCTKDCGYRFAERAVRYRVRFDPYTGNLRCR